MRLWIARRLAAEEKRREWLEERERNVKLVNNEPGAWENITPIADDQAGRSTIAVRNTCGMNARQEVNRLMPKEPRWVAKPTAGVIEEDGVEVNNAERAVKVGAVANLVSLGSGFTEEAERCALDGEVGSTAVMLVGFMGVQGDVSHGTGVPTEVEEGEREELSAKSKRHLKRPGHLHAGITPWYPYFVRLDPKTVWFDYTAKTPKEVNWVIREFERPVEAMRAEFVNRVDPETGEVKRERKYRIPEAIMGIAVDGKERLLKCKEAHYRVASEDPESTKDGSEWWILAWIEEKESGGTVTECIRWEKYAIDVGGCAVKIYSAHLVNDDLLGYVPGIRDSIQSARYFNSLVSMQVDWAIRNKTKRLYNPKFVDPADIQSIASAEAEDFIPVSLKGDGTFDQAFGLLPANPIPDSLPAAIAQMGQLTNEGSGRSENQRGAPAGMRTASEAQIVQAETSLQVAAKQRRFRKFMEECMRAGLIILTHVMPERGPRKDGSWEIPDPDNPGRFIQFSRKDLGARCEIEIDLLSQVLKDDTVVVAQGLQLIDLAAKVLQAPPDIQRKVMPLFQRVCTAMGPDWEATGMEMFRIDPNQPHPHLEHIAMLGGQEIEPNPAEDLRMHLDLHRAMLLNGPRENPDLWLRELGVAQGEEGPALITPAVLLFRHMQATEALMQKTGQRVPGGDPAGNQAGSGVGSGRTQGAVPNPGEIAAGAENAMMPNTPGARGMQG